MSVINVPIKDGETLFDVCLRTYGSINYFFKLIGDNSITDITGEYTGISVAYDDTLKYKESTREIQTQSTNKVYTVVDNQNIFDLSLQIYGSVDFIFDVINNNNINNIYTDVLVGSKINYNEVNNDNSKFFRVNQIKVTTGINLAIQSGLNYIETADGIILTTDDDFYLTID